MKIYIWLKHTSDPIEYVDIKNSYEKGAFYCIWLNSGKIVKYPINDIFRVEEIMCENQIDLKAAFFKDQFKK